MNVKHTPGIQDFVLTFRGVFWYPKMEPPPEPVGCQGSGQTCDHPEGILKFVLNFVDQIWSHVWIHPMSQ